jgi:hypothetical protein
LPQGGLEIPCTLTFSGAERDIASTLNCSGRIQIYDSIYDILDEETKNVIVNLLELSSSPTFDLVQVQKQVGGQDCGLFAIGIVLSLLFHIDVTSIVFNQSQMRPHLLKCFNNKEFTLFPLV